MSNKLFGIYERKTLDNPGSAMERISEDRYLLTLFTDELNMIRNAITIPDPQSLIEIGAAGGITKLIWPEVVTTDVRTGPGVDKVMYAEKIDAPDSTLDVLFGMDALHHVRSPQKHFSELVRALKIGGNAIYIEPNWNLFSKFCFKILLKYLHPEPYDTKQKNWELSNPDPMMGNQAQALNIFVRDAEKFRSEFPELKVEILEPLKGPSFLFSGGVHTRLPIPSAFLILGHRLENRFPSLLGLFGLGRIIRLTKVSI